MKKNRYLAVGALGAISTIPGEILSKVLVSLGIGQYPTYELNSLLVLSDEPQFWIGMFINFIVGGLTAVIFYIVFEKWWDTNLVVIKCIIGSWIAWLVYEIMFTAIIEGKSIQVRPISDHVVHIISTGIYGLTLGLLLKGLIYNKKFNS